MEEQTAVALAIAAAALCCCIAVASVLRSRRFRFREGSLPTEVLPTTAVGKLRHGLFDKRFQNTWHDRLVDRRPARRPEHDLEHDFISVASAPTTAFTPPVAVHCLVRERIEEIYVEHRQTHLLHQINGLMLEWRGNEQGLLAQVESDLKIEDGTRITEVRPTGPTQPHPHEGGEVARPVTTIAVQTNLDGTQLLQPAQVCKHCWQRAAFGITNLRHYPALLVWYTTTFAGSI